MSQWTEEEFSAIGGATELRLATARPDGTLRPPVTIWVVRIHDGVYVRAIKGRSGTWFLHALDQHKGRLEAGGVTKDVAIAEADEGSTAEVDAAYKDKYRSYGYRIVGSTLSTQAQAATLKLEPSE